MRKLYASLSPEVDQNIIKHYENLSLENIEGEIWRDIVGFETLYQISNLGRVKSLYKIIRGAFNKTKGEYGTSTKREMIKKQKIDRYGYNVVNLSPKAQEGVVAGKRKHITVHRLVAMAFIPNPENKSQINHKNGIKYNNVPENLEWATVKQNNIHAVDVLHRKTSTYWAGKKGKDHTSSKPIFQYDLKGNLIKRFDSMTSAANSVGASNCGISMYIYRKNKNPDKIKQAYGYHWALK